MLATNFVCLCPKVTKVGSQNFGYQIWFCTRPIMSWYCAQNKWMLVVSVRCQFQAAISQKVYDLQIEILKNDFYHNFYSTDPIMTQFRTCHDSSAVMACAKLWYDWSNIFQVRTTHTLQGLDYELLTHWGRDEMNNISQTTFSNVFSSMKMFEFWLKFHWSLFPRVQ